MEKNLSETDIRNQVDEDALELLVQLGVEGGEVDIHEIMLLLPGLREDPQLLDTVIEWLKGLDIQITNEQELDRDQENETGENGNGKLQEAGGSASDLEGIRVDDLVSIYFRDTTHVPLLSREEEVELSKKIERGRWARVQLAGNGNNPEMRKRLRSLIQEGSNARRHLIKANSRLVISVAQKFTGRGVPFIDLIQDGNIGLMRAVKKFDHSRGYKFSTYATWWIRQAITRSVANQGRTIRLPAYMNDQIVKMNWTREKLTKELERDPSVEELASALEVTPKKLQFMRRVANQTLSLNKPKYDEDDAEFGDFVPDADAPGPEESAAQSVLRIAIDRVFERLPPREARVLRMRYGLDGKKPHTLKEVGDKLGVSRERVRQIESRAKRRFRRYAPHGLINDF